MSNTALLEKDISELIGLTGIEGEERDDMLIRIGELVFESVMTRVVADMSEEEADAFQSYLEGNPDPADLLNYLRTVVPDVDNIFEEEVVAFKKECIAVLGKE